MNKFFKPLIVMAAGLVLMSCSMNDSGDYYSAYKYMTLNTSGDSYYFTGDDGKTYYPGDTRRVGYYDTTGKNGNRVFVYYDLLPENVPGYDYNLAVHEIVDILSKDIEVAETPDQVAAAGDAPLVITGVQISGGWIDMKFNLMSNLNSTLKHKMTLLDNRTVDTSFVPEGYQYLEFRQLPQGSYNPDLVRGYASYRLKDYAPSSVDDKGLYIRFRNLNGNVEYLKVEFPVSGENKAAFNEKPTVYRNWLE